MHYTLINDYDSAVDGHAWANDTINRNLQIWAVGSGMYCASVSDEGGFVTFAGTSPAGSGVVAAGIAGKIKGGYTTVAFAGTYAPTRSVRGNLGIFDLQCTDAYNCPGAHPSYRDYFSAISGDDLAVWGWSYHTSQNGTWNNVYSGNSGDITS